MREAAKLEVSEGGGTREPIITKGGRTVYADQTNLRPEARLEDPSHSANRPELEPVQRGPAPKRPDGSESVREIQGPASRPALAPATTARRRSSSWTEPDVAEQPASYAIYRPETGSTTREPATPRVRSEAK
jgi:hypothetical protein